MTKQLCYNGNPAFPIPKCVDGSTDHHMDPIWNIGWKCRDCKAEILMYGDKVVHLTFNPKENHYDIRV